jgi:hypothetical protein
MGFIDDILSSIFGKVKSDLSYRAGSGISDGLTNVAKKGVGGDKTPACPKCKKKIVDPGLKFCSDCGQKIVARCEKCSIDFPAGTKFCTNCGEQTK